MVRALPGFHLKKCRHEVSVCLACILYMNNLPFAANEIAPTAPLDRVASGVSVFVGHLGFAVSPPGIVTT
jgi:hypothetical protein